MTCDLRVLWGRLARAALVPGAILLSGPVAAQYKSPAERIQDLEKANEELRARIEALEKEMSEAAAQERPGAEKAPARAAEPLFANGVLTIGGVKLELGGRAELLLIDPQGEDDPIAGRTENPDPHFELDRLRIEPVFRFSRAISVHGQVDFEPTDGGTVLKELTARYAPEPFAWWFDAEVRLGLDDRFIRPARRTKNYPLVGNAFWRRESLALAGSIALGDKDGPQAVGGGGAEGGVGSEESTATFARTRRPGPSEEAPPPPAGAASEGEGGIDLSAGPVVVVRRRDPFDFAWNPGEFRLFFSVGNGYELDANEVGNDRARFNDLVIDDRDLQENLSIRELGVGLEYRRNFDWLGEIGVLGFYYNDELSDDSVAFLEEELTVRVGGVPVAGFGDVRSRDREIYGANVDYFLPAASLFGRGADVRRGDGLRLSGQWLRATDDRLEREGWYVQASYRYSFPSQTDASGKRSRGLIARRYVRSVEPIVRYGELDVNIAPDPRLPGLWDRKEFLVGLFVEISGGILLKAEYVFHREETGASASLLGPSKVRNDELLLELLLEF